MLMFCIIYCCYLNFIWHLLLLFVIWYCPVKMGKRDSQNVFNFPSVRSPAVLCWGSSTLTFKSAVDGFDSSTDAHLSALSDSLPPSASKWRPLHPSSRRACMRYSGKIHLTRSPTAPRADRRRTQHPRDHHPQRSTRTWSRGDRETAGENSQRAEQQEEDPY